MVRRTTIKTFNGVRPSMNGANNLMIKDGTMSSNKITPVEIGLHISLL